MIKVKLFNRKSLNRNRNKWLTVTILRRLRWAVTIPFIQENPLSQSWAEHMHELEAYTSWGKGPGWSHVKKLSQVLHSSITFEFLLLLEYFRNCRSASISRGPSCRRSSNSSSNNPSSSCGSSLGSNKLNESRIWLYGKQFCKWLITAVRYGLHTVESYLWCADRESTYNDSRITQLMNFA